MNDMMETYTNQKLQNTAWRVGIYCRLSKDDELEGESASIGNQRAMLEDFCRTRGWEVMKVYQDDGYTGLNTSRPAFQNLLGDIEKGIINLVITKDQSRLGRNHVDTGRLMEEYFPKKGVRYIAVNDCYDSHDERGNNEFAPMKNFFNELYSRDISKKVHSSYFQKAKEGKFTGCVAPFGYKKDADNRNHLVIDEETAPYVRMMFSLALNGAGPNHIQRTLERQHVPCPTWWNRQRGIRTHNYTRWEKQDAENGRYVWDFSVIKDILKNPVYCGDIASQKYEYKFKVGAIREKSADEWIIVRNTHEPIVSREDFELVQRKVRQRQRTLKTGDYSLFAGLIKCGECGKALTFRKTHAKKPMDIYACVTYNKFGAHHCTQHRVEFDLLYEQVLKEIRKLARQALADKEAIIERLKETESEETTAMSSALSQDVTKAKERVVFLDRMIMKLYEDMMAGKLTEEQCDRMVAKAQREQADLKEEIARNSTLLESRDRLVEDNTQWLELISQYTDIQELDAATLNRLIRQIIVHEQIDGDKTRHITAEIHFNLKPFSADKNPNFTIR